MITSLFFVILAFAPQIYASIPIDSGSIIFTDEEKAFLEQYDVIKVAHSTGVAPFFYLDSKGNTQGITKQIFDVISAETGLSFSYQGISGINAMTEGAANGSFDILACIPDQYIPGNFDRYQISEPFLESKTILFIRSDISANSLYKLRYGGVKGSPLPEGVNPATAILFDSREDSLDAVETGKADYGFGNEFSVSYYIVRNDYTHINTMPQKIEPRAYRMIYISPDDRLASIINKSLANISITDMQRIIFQSSTTIERKIPLSGILSQYADPLKIITIALILLLCILVFIMLRAYRGTKELNDRMIQLSDISDEYIYEYDILRDYLKLTESCHKLLRIPRYTEHFRKVYSTGELETTLTLNTLMPLLNPTEHSQRIELKSTMGTDRFFKIVKSIGYDKHRMPVYILGKLVDISDDIAEKNSLLDRAQRDSLTNLYNAEACRMLIKNEFTQLSSADKSALMLLDLDNFKSINDDYGHLSGDQVLQAFANALSLAFRGTDIIGRVGGDEFCVFLRSPVDRSSINKRVSQLKREFQNQLHNKVDFQVTFSAGATFIHAGQIFNDTYQKADQALYKSKRNGRNCLSFL